MGNFLQLIDSQNLGRNIQGLNEKRYKGVLMISACCRTHRRNGDSACICAWWGKIGWRAYDITHSPARPDGNPSRNKCCFSCSPSDFWRGTFNLIYYCLKIKNFWIFPDLTKFKLLKFQFFKKNKGNLVFKFISLSQNEIKLIEIYIILQKRHIIRSTIVKNMSFKAFFVPFLCALHFRSAINSRLPLYSSEGLSGATGLNQDFFNNVSPFYMQYANVLRRDQVQIEMDAANGHPDHSQPCETISSTTNSLSQFLKIQRWQFTINWSRFASKTTKMTKATISWLIGSRKLKYL